MIALDISLKSRSTRQIGTALGLGILLGYTALVLAPSLVLGGMMGLILLIAAFTNPESVILVVLCFVLGLIPASFNPYVRLAGRGLFASDLVLILLLAVLMFRLIADRKFPYLKTPLDAPLLFFCAAVVIAMGTAVLNHGIKLSDATYEARILLYYLIFFAVTNLIRTRSQLVRLIRGILLIGLLVAGTVVTQASLGRSFLLMDESILRGGKQLIRFYHPGLLAVYVALITLICDMTLRRHHQYRLLHPLLVLVLGVSFLVGITRNALISGAISLAVLISTLRQSQLSRLAGSLLLIACIAVGIAAALGISGKESLVLEYSAEYLGRLTGMFSSTILSSEETLVPRWREIQYAWPHIVQNPIFGIGVETPYRPPFFEGDPLTAYIHNAYVWIWLKTGLLGLVPFLWLSVRFLRRGFRYWRDVQDDFLRALSLGLTLTYLSTMISNLVAPLFVEDWSLAIFGVMLGINELILKGNEAIDKEGGMHGIQYTAIPS